VSAADDRGPRAGTLDRDLSILDYFVKVREAPASGVVDALGLSQSAILSSDLGSRQPLHCTSLGKAYVSTLPDASRLTLIGELELKRYTANTITDAAALEADIASTEERGYAVDRIEVEEGVASLGAPVRGYAGLPVAAISVAGPAEQVLDQENRMGPLVGESALAISRRLGYVVTLTERE
jgi:DNA-binding IclR family transcriptional regulator